MPPGKPDEISCVLFDLDGTLLDTAPDMGRALNAVLVRHGRSPWPMERIRPEVSNGSARLIRLAFELDADSERVVELRGDFLEYYERNVCVDTRPFDGMNELLDALDAHGTAWGVVTNKPEYLARPLLDALGLLDRAACVIGGDTAAAAKPDPAPILLALEQTGCARRSCVYVGDAERDIAAGRAAGTRTLAALFGYIPDYEDPLSWRADGSIEHPMEILTWLGRTATVPA